MDEAEKFAAEIMGNFPENPSDDDSNELLTNNEEETSNIEEETQEDSRPSNEELSETQQEESETNTESNLKPEPKEPKRGNRIERRIQSLLAKQNELQSQNTYDSEDTLTHEQLREEIRKEAQILFQQQEIARLEEERTEAWADDLESLIENNPELNPESDEYNKPLDDFLTKLITDKDGNANTEVPIAEIYSQLRTIIGEKKQIQAMQSKKTLNRQFDETSLSNGLQGDYNKAKKTVADLDPNNPTEFIRMIEEGLV